MVRSHLVMASAVVVARAGVDDGLTETGHSVQQPVVHVLGDVMGSGEVAVGGDLDFRRS